MQETLNKKESFYGRNRNVILLASFCCLLWGSAPAGIKLGYQLFQIDSADTWSILLFAGTRFLLAGSLVILFTCVSEKRIVTPRKTSWKYIFALACFQTIIQYFFFYVGTANCTGVKASIITGSNSFISVLVACLLFRQEKLTFNKLLGCMVGLAGILLINLQGSGASDMTMSLALNGEGFIIISTVSGAVSAALIRIFSQKENPVLMSGYQFFTGGLTLATIGLLQGGRFHAITPGGILLLMHLACVSAVAYTLWGVLLKYNPVSKVTVFSFLTPVFGVILSAILLGESSSFNLITIVSLALVCLSIAIVNRVNKEKK